ncbi:MAG: carbon-nitrogen hydrolase family protein [Planctomycetota bacterium]
MTTRTIATAQTIPVRGDVDANLEEHVRLALAAAKARARVLLFPELSLTGYELDLAHTLAFSEEDMRLDALRALAETIEMTLIVGAPARVGEKLHIGAFILLPNGSVDLYTKQHLGAFPPETNPGGAVPPAENTVFNPGDRNPLVHFGGHTAAIAVCADTGRPAHAQAAADRDAGCYLASMFFTPNELEEETAKLQAYAAKHSVCVVLSNFGGRTGGLEAAGSSAIWAETGELLAQLEPRGAGIAVATESETGWRTHTTMLGDR